MVTVALIDPYPIHLKFPFHAGSTGLTVLFANKARSESDRDSSPLGTEEVCAWARLSRMTRETDRQARSRLSMVESEVASSIHYSYSLTGKLPFPRGLRLSPRMALLR